jgi:hypothetical protein
VVADDEGVTAVVATAVVAAVVTEAPVVAVSDADAAGLAVSVAFPADCGLDTDELPQPLITAATAADDAHTATRLINMRVPSHDPVSTGIDVPTSFWLPAYGLIFEQGSHATA